MGGSKTAILAQVVHFYSDGVDHITIGGDNRPHVETVFRVVVSKFSLDISFNVCFRDGVKRLLGIDSKNYAVRQRNSAALDLMLDASDDHEFMETVNDLIH
jgi:hypothetical protein